MNDLYDAAIEADKNGNITAWMIEYLKESGRNPTLAQGLLADGQFHTSLIDYPIDELKILMGPDTSFRYYEELNEYEARIEAMLDSLRQGWKPVPLIATKDLWNEGLELNDGAHRAEALKRFGVTTYPTVFYFKDKVALNSFLRSIK